MSAPVLTKTQKKLSLAGKKAKKEIIKNVVVDPHKSYWPLVVNELETLTKVLKENLPKVKPVKINIPWRLLKDVPKDERRNVRETYIKKHGPVENVVKEDSLIFGVNDVTKSLESDSCSAVLVAEMNPKIVVKHLIEMSVLNKVPVLVVSTLKQTLKDCCGLESMAVAIKKNSTSSNLANIVKIVQEVNEIYPVNDNHIHTSRTLLTPKMEDNENNEPKKPVQIKEKKHIPVNYHLIKPSDKERAFVPPLYENKSQDVIRVETDRFQSVNPTPCEPENSPYAILNDAMKKKKKENKKKHYKALEVKRLKGNKNRKKEMKKLDDKK